MNLEMAIRAQGFEIFIGVVFPVFIAMVNRQMMRIVIATLFAAKPAIVALHCKNEAANSVVRQVYDCRPAPSRVITFARTISAARFFRKFSAASFAYIYMIAFPRCVGAFARTILDRKTLSEDTCKRSTALLAGVNWQKISAPFSQPIPVTLRTAKPPRPPTLHHPNFNSAVLARTGERPASFVITLPTTKLRGRTVIARLHKCYAAVLACVCVHRGFSLGEGADEI